MSIAFAFVALLMLVIMGIGLVLGLFFRGRRKFGWKLMGASLLGFIVALGVANYTFDRTGSTKALAATQDDGPNVQQSRTETVAEAPPIEAPKRFGVTAIAAYCDGYQKTLDAIHEADRKFGIEGTDEKAVWVKEKDQAIGAATGKAIGAPFEEWQPVAEDEHWDQQCQAKSRGWLAVEDADLLAAEGADADTVVAGLEITYRAKIAEGRDLPFSRYGTVKCGWKELTHYHFAACTLSGGSNGGRSDPYLYFVGHKGGDAVVIPFDNEAVGHLAGQSAAEANGSPIPIGWYIAVPFRAVAYSEVRALFE